MAYRANHRVTYLDFTGCLNQKYPTLIVIVRTLWQLTGRRCYT
jgi:hypothetical protein